MSAIGAAVALITTAVPITFGATRRMHERWRARWRLRHHAELDTTAREGDLVFVSGTVRALDETLVAPLSGRPCVAYRARARGEGSTRGGSTYSSLWQETMQLRPFAIDRDDGAGEIIVIGDRAIFGVPPQSLSPRNPERETSFLARHAIRKVRPRFHEVVVEPGARVQVGGTLVLVPREVPPTGELGFRDPPPPDPQLVGNRDAPLVIVSRGR